jgi:hypothetical protein
MEHTATRAPLAIALLALAASACGDASGANGRALTVMSYNIYLGGRVVVSDLAATAAVIEAAGADLIGLQEQFGSAEEIAALLGFTVVVQSPTVAYLSRFPVIEAGAASIRVEVCPGEDVVLADVHLAPYPYGPYDIRDDPSLSDQAVVDTALATRGAAITDVLDLLEPDLAAGTPTFLVGDFNEPSHLDWTPQAAAAGLHFGRAIEWPTSLLVEGSGLADVYRLLVPDEVAFPASTWTPLPGPDEVFDRIDIVYYAGRGLVPTDVAIVGESAENADIVVTPYPSDHRAVAATFRYAGCPEA